VPTPTPSPSIPEFPTWILLPALLIFAALVAAAVKREKNLGSTLREKRLALDANKLCGGSMGQDPKRQLIKYYFVEPPSILANLKYV
jgi:hypothetical protein